jgi:molybdenum cofactor guanylyltransferase
MVSDMKSFIILCGGMSTRMGQDKGSMNIYGKPMIIHVLNTIAKIADEIVLVLRDETQVHVYKNLLKELKDNRSIFKICTDVVKDQGPLEGILTGLMNTLSNKSMVIPCDSPFVSELFIMKMFEQSKDTNFDAFVPKWSDGKLEPLHSIYKKELKSTIKKLLDEDVKDVQSLLSKSNVKFIDVQSLDNSGRSFLNINQMKDISKFD